MRCAAQVALSATHAIAWLGTAHISKHHSTRASAHPTPTILPVQQTMNTTVVCVAANRLQLDTIDKIEPPHNTNSSTTSKLLAASAAVTVHAVSAGRHAQLCRVVSQPSQVAAQTPCKMHRHNKHWKVAVVPVHPWQQQQI